jgi:hypothetical protein
MISDAMLETDDYRGGKSHKGIQQAGKYLVQKHQPLLEMLLKESKRTKLRLSLIGHSLGAGAASIAAMEFNDLDFCEAKAIGFGCPALLSQELSERTKDYITTVVCDGDCVSRMSGSTIANLVMDILSTRYVETALEDVAQLLDAVASNLPFKPSEEQKQGVLDFLREKMEEAHQQKKVESERVPVELYPPGKCIHLFRDGAGISATYVPCTFFKALDVSRTMVQDHMINMGYN